MSTEIVSSTFVLAVNDLKTSRAFYIDQLGFIEEFQVPGWAFLRRGSCQIRLGDCPEAVPMSKCQDHSWFAYLHVKNSAELFREFCQKDVPIWHALEDKPWGFREFAIVTPDGHRIVFGERLAV